MRFIRQSLLAAVAICTFSFTTGQNAAVKAPKLEVEPESVLLFVGTYTRDEGWVNGQGKGVHVFKMNTVSGALTPVGEKAFGSNPTFITGTRGKTRPVLYATNEVVDDSKLKPGTKTGYVYAITVDASGAMTELNHVESGGAGATHISMSPNQDYLAVANFAGGSVSLFPLAQDGSLKPASDFHQYEGGSKVASKNRQDAPHMHSMTWVSNTSTVLGADLGNDRIAQFNLDPTAGKLVKPKQNEFIVRPPGSGPRHMAIHPSKNYAYVVDEIANTVGVYSFDKTGTLSPSAIQLISALPPDFKEFSSAADIHVSECGKFVYSSNRFHDSITIFEIDQATGKLTFSGTEPTRGKTPRSFLLYKNLLVVANQDSSDLQVFFMDHTTGKLTHSGQSVKVGTPVRVFIPQGW